MINDTIALTKGIRSEFLRRQVMPGPNLIQRLATIVPSTASSETYGWFGETPQMEEFKDQVKYSGFSDATYAILNKEFARGIQVKRKEIDDDQIGIIMTRVRQLADRARKFPLKLLFDALVAGETALCYDGLPFFSSAHPARGQAAAQDNLLAGTGISVAALKTDIGTAITTLKTFVDEANEPFHEDASPSDLVIVCGPELEQPMREALGAGIISNTSNMLVGQVGELIVNQRYSQTNDWDLLHLGDAIKPLVFQERSPLEFTELVDGEDNLNKLVWSFLAYMRGNVGYGMWQDAVRTKNA